MNILHMKYAVEVARVGSLNKAAESLYVALPNVSRSIRELEADLGITIFDRSARGMTLTPEGEEFIGYAKGILAQIEQVERLYRDGAPGKQKFSISVPRACYISDAFAQFSRALSDAPAEIFYKETNSKRTIQNILEHDYQLGIIRYAENYDKHFKAMLEEKGLNFELVTEFSYLLVMSRECPLAQKDEITYDDLSGYIEIAHADPYVPSLSMARVLKEEHPDNIDRRIFVFERASQFELLSQNPQTFMWVSPVPSDMLERFGLVERRCEENKRVYKDMLVYRKGYKLTGLDQQFITALCEAKRKHL
ncbi:MAG: LysR family transcriptional regulator [Clostridia bacterium]|nr:LysR family transcriptional regulator [Clostridia bacterium]